MAKVNVLFADTFDKAYQSLDATIQRRVVDFMLKLRREPDAPGLNLKQPHGARDKHVWTARVNDNFRAVLWRPDNTTFYLASIKAHDDAYVYAAQTIWNVNNVTGGVEFYDHGALREILVRTGDSLPTAHDRPGFFDQVLTETSPGLALHQASYRPCGRSVVRMHCLASPSRYLSSPARLSWRWPTARQPIRCGRRSSPSRRPIARSIPRTWPQRSNVPPPVSPSLSSPRTLRN